MEHSQQAVEAVGKMSEALETLERARGHLYSFHQLVGEADFKLDGALVALRAAGADDLARRIESELVGRNVIPDRWTFQVVEEFDDTYYSAAVAAERAVRDALLDGQRHVFESEMKEQRRTPGEPAHELLPAELAAGGDVGLGS
jgi:hypothetical protein